MSKIFFVFFLTNFKKRPKFVPLDPNTPLRRSNETNVSTIYKNLSINLLHWSWPGMRRRALPGQVD